MKITIVKRVEAVAKHLKMSVAVRYGDEDMPFDAPMREGDIWKAMIDLSEGRVLDWPMGQTLSFEDMKVCDQGTYILFDADNNEITRIEGYVPNKLLPGKYGDYLSLDIDETGKITNWLDRPSLKDFMEEVE